MPKVASNPTVLLSILNSTEQNRCCPDSSYGLYLGLVSGEKCGLGDKEPYFVLKSTAERIQEFTAGLTPEQLATPPEPGKWSIHQIVAHLADVDLVFQTRARMIIFQDTPTLVSFDQDPWVLGWAREQEPWAETVEKFTVLRRSILRLFLNAEGHDLTRYGVHTERGPQTINDYVEMMAGHDINHLQQIERVRGAVSSK